MMEWRNAQYTDIGIDCEINHPALGWIPFHAVAGDTGSFLDVDALIAEMEASEQVSPYVPPGAEELRARMAPLSRRQTFIMLASEGFLTEAEAEQAAAGQAVPATIAATFDALVTAGTWTAAERLGARITFLSFTHAYRTDPMVPLLVAAAPTPPTDEQLDTWWQSYLTI